VAGKCNLEERLRVWEKQQREESHCRKSHCQDQFVKSLINSAQKIKLYLKHNRKQAFLTLFTIAKLWKQPRCPTTDEWIKKMWYLNTMEFYAAMKKNEMLSFAGKWMELENIILSEVSLAQKTKICMFSLICRH
jgi:hypothetical protein